jgi:N-carbamoyl-L-amino-acid hydrolase
MDSVLRGGNYDGAAGVVAGLAAVEALKSLDVQCQRDITVMAIRAEEAAWFIGRHGGHLGSRMALGLLNPTELDTAVRSDSGRTLGEHMSELGCNVEAIRRKQPSLTPARIHGYLELHIEQGPVLEERGFPIGVVTAIRGNSRLRDARCVGRYNHGGGTPQEHRKDAVLATAELITRVEDEWRRLHSAGRDLTFTFGKTFTDAKMHSMSKVPGEVRFTLDLRSGEPDTLGHMRGFVQRCAESIGERRGLKFELGAFSVTEPAVMDPALRRAMISGCQTLEIPYRELASGGGHDAQEFSSVGIPTAMIFIRNANGSHVAEESMEMPDFTLGTTLMTWMLCSEKGGER